MLGNMLTKGLFGEPMPILKNYEQMRRMEEHAKAAQQKLRSERARMQASTTDLQAIKIAIYEIRKIEDEYAKDGCFADHLTGARAARQVLEDMLKEGP